MMALQLQAADRAKLVKENIEMRREKLDADEQMKEHDAKVIDEKTVFNKINRI